MTPKWLATGLDQVLIRLWLRPSLPALSPTSPLTQLHLAEQRTRLTPSDDRLFPALSDPTFSTTDCGRSSDGMRRLARHVNPPTICLESEWFPEAIPSRSVCSHWYVRQSSRPLLIAVTGWQPIGAIAAEHLWPIKQLDRAGFDVAILKLPAVRVSSASTAKARFPSHDPSCNLIALARFTCCIQQLLLIAKSRGHERIVIWGTSLGAHLVALLATVEQPTLADHYMLEKPLVRMSDPLRLHGRGSPCIRRDVALRLDRVYRAVSPIERPSRVDPNRVHVISALSDCVTPASGARQLAEHFGATVHPVEGSHLWDPDRSKRTVAMMRLATTNSP